MKTVKCFNTGTFHRVNEDNENRTKCGREIKAESVGGWGAKRERDFEPQNLCRACSGEREFVL